MAVTYFGGQKVRASDLVNSAGIPVVSATSAVAAPFTGSVVFNTTDNSLYRYDGAQWIKFTGYAKYARRSGDGTQPLGASADTLLSFPTTVQSHALVTPSGTGNTGFTLQPGTWIAEVSIRQNASQAGALYLCAGTPAAVETEAISGQDATSIVRLASTTLQISSPTAVYAVAFNAGAATTSVNYGADLNHIAFTRMP